MVAFTTEEGAIGNASEAARRAGYSEKSARELGCRLVNTPHVREAIDEALRRHLSGPLATKATALLERALDDPDVPMKLKLDAAKTVLDRANFGATRAPDLEALASRARKPIGEMGIPELEARLEELLAARLERREVVGSA